MQISEYAVKARSLNIYPPEAKFFGPAFGVAGECGELVEKIQYGGSDDELIKEIGDVLWYLVNVLEDIEWSFIDAVNYHAEALALEGSLIFNGTFSSMQAIVEMADDNDPRPLKDPISHLAIYSGKIAEIAKKSLRDNQGVVPEGKRKVVGKYVVLILDLLCRIATTYEFNMDDMARVNLDKLFDRRDRGVLRGSGDDR